MTAFISKSEFDDAFETALNKKSRNPEDWMFESFPEDLSTWECCVERHDDISKKARMWDALKHTVENGTWAGDISEHPIVIAMCNIEHEVGKAND